jgi:homoserine dehydrogenase
MRPSKLIVLKFGGSVLRTESDYAWAVHEIYRWRRQGYGVVAVVSAIAGATERLLSQADPYGGTACAVATLVATGELTSAALMGLALDRAGVPAKVLSVDRIGLVTKGPALDAMPVGVNSVVIRNALSKTGIAVIPGFAGEKGDGRITLLGRGGSDLTALFLAHHLRPCRCRLIKDVAGVYDAAPARGQAARCFRDVHWDELLAMGGRVVQAKAVRWARAHGVRFEVAAANASLGTRVGWRPSVIHHNTRGAERITIGLMGLGNIGSRIFEEVLRHRPKFDLLGVAVRGSGRKRPPAALPYLMTAEELLELRPQVLIDATADTQSAGAIVEAALGRGCHVVTANKALVADRSTALGRVLSQRRGSLCYSAAVGGSVPMIETVRRIARREPIRAINGIFNGTANWVLDQVRAGSALEEAVQAAIRAGLAEPDPSRDVDGTDVVHKLRILSREAFGQEPVFIDRDVRFESVALAKLHRGRIPRLIGSLQMTSGSLRARVEIRSLPLRHPLARIQGAGNAICVETCSGERIFVRGLGAGPWPTAEAIMADALELARWIERQRNGRRLARLGDRATTLDRGTSLEGKAPSGDGVTRLESEGPAITLGQCATTQRATREPKAEVES